MSGAQLDAAPFRRVAIVGMGLIGGSVARATRLKHPDVAIRGHDRRDLSHVPGLSDVVDQFCPELEAAVSDAELVMIATPGDAVPGLVADVHRHAPDAVITDVCGAKSAICDAARAVVQAPGRFIGGHPMAGTENNGFEASRADLFVGAAWILCIDANDDASEPRLARWIEGLGARVVTMSPREHDRMVAVISHLPQLAAVAMLNVAAEQSAPLSWPDLVGRGFRDTTRIGSSPFGTWQDVLSSNRQHIEPVLERFISEMNVIRAALADGATGLRESFERAAAVRSRLGRRQDDPDA